MERNSTTDMLTWGLTLVLLPRATAARHLVRRASGGRGASRT